MDSTSKARRAAKGGRARIETTSVPYKASSNTSFTPVRASTDL